MKPNMKSCRRVQYLVGTVTNAISHQAQISSPPLCLLTDPPITSSIFLTLGVTSINQFYFSGTRWRTMPSFPSWSRWCSWLGCATPFSTSIRCVLDSIQATKKHELIDWPVSKRICNVCETAIPQIPASESCSSSQSFRRRLHPVPMIQPYNASD